MKWRKIKKYLKNIRRINPTFKEVELLSRKTQELIQENKATKSYIKELEARIGFLVEEVYKNEIVIDESSEGNFWYGDEGIQYIIRNPEKPSTNKTLRECFSKILLKTPDVNSIIELGCGNGRNLVNIQSINRNIKITGVEINPYAVFEARRKRVGEIILSSLLNFKTDLTYDLVLLRGTLVTINPDDLDAAYDLIYKLSNKYIVIWERQAEENVEVSYRSTGKLYVRDFVAEICEKYNNVKLVDSDWEKHSGISGDQKNRKWVLLEKS